MAQKQDTTEKLQLFDKKVEKKFQELCPAVTTTSLTTENYIIFLDNAARLFGRLNKRLELNNSYYAYIFAQCYKHLRLTATSNLISSDFSHQFCAARSDDALPHKYHLPQCDLSTFAMFFRLLYNAVIKIYIDPELMLDRSKIDVDSLNPNEYPALKSIDELETSGFDLLVACQVLHLSDKDAVDEYEKLVTAKTAKVGPGHDSVQGSATATDVHEQGQEGYTPIRSLRN